jgi:type IV secretion system protein TrbE
VVAFLMLALKQFRDKAQGVADLLNWSHLTDDGIVQGKDGSLIAGWFYRGPDIASSTDSERNWLSERVNAALAKLGGGWAQWTDSARLPSASYPPPELSHFPDPVSRLVMPSAASSSCARARISRANTRSWCSTRPRSAATPRLRT